MQRGWSLNISQLAPPSHRQMKTLPQLLFRDVIKPLLSSQQMEPEEFLKYTKPIGSSPNFEQQVWLQGGWITLCQGKLVEDPVMCTTYVLLSIRSTMPYDTDGGAAEWDVKTLTVEA
eukprot:4345777-Karenia_brevis.AAC.1